MNYVPALIALLVFAVIVLGMWAMHLHVQVAAAKRLAESARTIAEQQAQKILDAPTTRDKITVALDHLNTILADHEERLNYHDGALDHHEHDLHKLNPEVATLKKRVHDNRLVFDNYAVKETEYRRFVEDTETNLLSLAAAMRPKPTIEETIKAWFRRQS